ncbi:Uncharacterized protein SAPIO_CDS6076 [Scedosporium apiospermum]|uniref:Autophagy-related protein 14 n=1 Tax=Pseudallescheria apiosperma TaxID=563466 RepID=A0A084G4G2_PSEDA|nr:Uncharacterized protein SAPIO_CDS6076 [Scedosporium apiospermum]KEZ42224.1 Uncharacterized protein SAPIO_CDS6076 [Scedosporium apiospermum]
MLQALLENEELRGRIDGLVSQADGELGESASPSSLPAKKLAMESLVSRQSAAEDRTAQILARAEKLRADVESARAEINARRETNTRRRSDLASVSNGIDARRIKALDETENATLSLRGRWNRNSDQMAGTRAFLCKEAAKLYGLKRIKKGSSKYEYKLGGIDVIDLTSMNALPPEVISTSLSHIAHILILASHYLALRLPAEINMPRSDHPRPTIYNLASSYRHADGEEQSLGNVKIKQSNGDDTSGNNRGPSDFGGGRNRDLGNTSRPRPLFVDKPLPVLAKEDPSAHSFFLEGVTLLAYDIAWACMTQNVPIGDRGSFEDLCNMGRNLYNLLIGQQLHNTQTPKLYPPLSAPSGTSDGDDPDQTKTGLPPPVMGRFSHGTTHTFLGSASGTEFIRSFKLPTPIKLADKLKKKLMSELTVPEWEVVENGDWEPDGAM